ncbi:hypothetical protein ACPCTO_03235 [Streptomyces olivoreticuli]
MNDIFRSAQSLILALMGMGTVAYLAHYGYIVDGETVSAIAAVLTSAVAVHRNEQ